MKILIYILASIFFISCDSETNNTSKKEEEILVGIETLPAYSWQSYQSDFEPSKDNPNFAENARIIISKNPESKKVQLNITIYYTSLNNISAMRFETLASGFLDREDRSRLDADVENVFLTPDHNEITKSFNEKKLCGFDDWVTYQYKEILYSACAKDSKTTFYLSLKSDFLTLYSCNENQKLDKSCKKIKAKLMH